MQYKYKHVVCSLDPKLLVKGKASHKSESNLANSATDCNDQPRLVFITPCFSNGISHYYNISQPDNFLIIFSNYQRYLYKYILNILH